MPTICCGTMKVGNWTIIKHYTNIYIVKPKSLKTAARRHKFPSLTLSLLNCFQFKKHLSNNFCCLLFINFHENTFYCGVLKRYIFCVLWILEQINIMLAFAIVVTQEDLKNIYTEKRRDRVSEKHNTICNWRNGIWFSFHEKNG